jgi:signal transduction histidine kinase
MNLIKTSIQQRFVKYITLMLTSFFASIVILIGIVDYLSLQELEHQHNKQRAQSSITSIVENFDIIQADIQNLAENSLVINSLIDASQSGPYINSTLNNLKVYANIEDAVIINASGEVNFFLKETNPTWLKPEYIRATLATNTHSIFFDNISFTAIYPIRYAQNTLGALAVNFAPNILLHRRISESGQEFRLQIGEWSYQNTLDWHELNSQLVKAPEHHQLNFYDTKLELKSNNSNTLDLMKSWLFNLVIAGIVGIFIIRWIANQVGKKMATPVVQLTTKIRAKKYPISPVGTGDELELVASAYDQAAKDLLRMNAVLEKRVYERTQELESKARSLKTALDDVRHLDTLKNRFISTVSHELRTPLTSIHGALGLLSSAALDNAPEKKKTLIDLAQKNSQRLAKLINDLLDFQKLEANSIDLDKQEVNLIELIQEAVEGSTGYQDLYDASVLFQQKETDPLYANIDGHRVRQVLDNLISNAIKYSPKSSSVEINISQQNNLIEISVRDFGSGVPDKFIPNLFLPFSQADSSDTRAHEGTGLGLSISQDLIKAHNGELLYTKANPGSNFIIRLPVK